jgi:hypothetical protein
MNNRATPAGQAVSDHIKESLKDPEFRAEYERLGSYEELARIVIMRRATLGLTQAELAAWMGRRHLRSRGSRAGRVCRLRLWDDG